MGYTSEEESLICLPQCHCLDKCFAHSHCVYHFCDLGPSSVFKGRHKIARVHFKKAEVICKLRKAWSHLNLISANALLLVLEFTSDLLDERLEALLIFRRKNNSKDRCQGPEPEIP